VPAARDGTPTHPLGYTIGVEDDSATSGSSTASLDVHAFNTYPEVKVSVTLEHGWAADPRSVLWTPASYRTSGANWARAVHDFVVSH
jgi:hypothetical protein